MAASSSFTWANADAKLEQAGDGVKRPEVRAPQPVPSLCCSPSHARLVAECVQQRGETAPVRLALSPMAIGTSIRNPWNVLVAGCSLLRFRALPRRPPPPPLPTAAATTSASPAVRWLRTPRSGWLSSAAQGWGFAPPPGLRTASRRPGPTGLPGPPPARPAPRRSPGPPARTAKASEWQ